ncbi:MAG: hypothetical protein M3N53_13125 [Actinomycetota bacterium]|nr:hypothetical protein [Actinomycetota bacterium]
MNDDPRIRDALKRRLDAVDSGAALPPETLHRAKRRRSKLMAGASLGIVACVMLVFVGSQVIQDDQLSVDLAPVTTPTPEGSSPPGDTKRDRNTPPSVTVRSSDQTVELTAWSYCFGNRCVSGGPPPEPPDVGSPEEVFVEFPLDDWSFDAFFTPAGEKCGRVQQVPVEDTGEGQLVLRPAGYAGAYDVTLFGKGDGSLSVTFRWTTPEDGSLPEPEARTAILAGSARNPDSYGIELALDNLAETPEQASATITVKAARGESLTFEAELARSRCRPEGSLYWDGPDDMGRQATQLGEGPFRYRVELVLDGKRYVAKATWPHDEISGDEPSVRLEFSPDLPSL